MTEVQLRRLVIDACDGPFGSAIKSDHYVDHGARVVRLGNIGVGEWRDDDKAFLSVDYWRELASHHAGAGDLVMAGLGDERNPVGRACVLPGDVGHALVKADCYRLRVDDSRADARYLSAFLSSHAGLAQAESLAEGSTRQRLTLGKALSVRVPALTVAAQRRIADYLHVETARIDALIAKKQQMVELVMERSAALIGKTVTIGFDTENLLATGDAFAPSVPDGWTLQRLRHVVREIIDTEHATAPIVPNGEYFVVRTANVKSGNLRLQNARYTDYDGFRRWTRRGVPSVGDVLFTREAPAGEACLVPENLDLCIGQRMVLIKPDESHVLGGWLVHSIYAGPARAFIETLAKSTTVSHLNMGDIPDIPIAVPPIELQRMLLRKLDADVGFYRALTRNLDQQILLLKEHRQALITAAVTGDMEVPGVSR